MKIHICARVHLYFKLSQPSMQFLATLTRKQYAKVIVYLLSNLQTRSHQQFRLSHDALYNLHEVAYDLDGLVAQITTYPDLIAICGSKGMINEMGRVLQSHSSLPQFLLYDTILAIFICLHCYSVTLTSLHTVILLLIHEKKSQIAHELMKNVSLMIPSLSKKGISIPIVTADKEAAIYNAIDKHLTFLTCLKCWNCILSMLQRYNTATKSKSNRMGLYRYCEMDKVTGPLLAQWVLTATVTCTSTTVSIPASTNA